jgi:hypothetical protein
MCTIQLYLEEIISHKLEGKLHPRETLRLLKLKESDF